MLKGLLSWAIVCIYVFGVGAYFFQEDIITTGTDIKLVVTSQRYFTVEASEEVTLEGVYSSYWVFYQENGNSITPIATKPPLGVKSDKYYSSGPKVFAQGRWFVAKGSPTIHVTSKQPVTITSILPNKPLIWFAAVICAFVFWFFGFCLPIILK